MDQGRQRKCKRLLLGVCLHSSPKHNKCFKLEFWWADYEGKLRIGHHEIPLDKKIWIDPKELYEANKTMTWVIEKLIKLAK